MLTRLEVSLLVLATQTIATVRGRGGVLPLSDHASALLFIWRFDGGLYERAHIIRCFPPLVQELGARFLADYLSGDKYFGTERPGQVSLERSGAGPSCAKAAPKPC